MSRSKSIPLTNKIVAGTLILTAVAFILSSYLFRGYNPDLKRLATIHAYEEQAMAFEKKMMFREAIQSYEKAIDPKLQTSDGSMFFAVAGLRKCHLQLGEYEAAKKYANLQVESNPEKFTDSRIEVDALESFSRSGNPSAVFDRINSLRGASKRYLPPHGFQVSAVSTVLWLYDIIGDYDAGIKFADESIDYLFKTEKDFEWMERNLTSSQAFELMKSQKELQLQKQSVKVDWRAYRLLREFLLVREAFEQDKAEGKKGCVGKKPGEVCLGRATKAIIQSDYFPW